MNCTLLKLKQFQIVTKHKIVIKESGASGEVRTYVVLLKKDSETKPLFELTDVTETVEKMTVNYSLSISLSQ